MRHRFPYIGSIEQWEQLLRAKAEQRDLVVFKVSPICNLSRIAEEQVDQWWESLPADPDVDVYMVDVLGDRAVSQHIEAHFDVVHESPQILWVGSDRTVRWHGSHRAVTLDNLAQVYRAERA